MNACAQCRRRADQVRRAQDEVHRLARLAALNEKCFAKHGPGLSDAKAVLAQNRAIQADHAREHEAQERAS